MRNKIQAQHKKEISPHQFEDNDSRNGSKSRSANNGNDTLIT